MPLHTSYNAHPRSCFSANSPFSSFTKLLQFPINCKQPEQTPCLPFNVHAQIISHTEYLRPLDLLTDYKPTRNPVLMLNDMHKTIHTLHIYQQRRITVPMYVAWTDTNLHTYNFHDTKE